MQTALAGAVLGKKLDELPTDIVSIQNLHTSDPFVHYVQDDHSLVGVQVDAAMAGPVGASGWRLGVHGRTEVIPAAAPVDDMELGDGCGQLVLGTGLQALGDLGCERGELGGQKKRRAPTSAHQPGAATS
jgi:hypothetical protein